MDKTPLTDAKMFSTYDGFAKKAPTIRVVSVEFARQLETDLAEAVAALKSLVDNCGDYETWQRPCLAYDKALIVLAKHSVER